MAERIAATEGASWGMEFEPEVELDQVLEAISKYSPATVEEVEAAIGLKLMPRVLRELKHGLAILATTPCIERPDKRVLICLAPRDGWQDIIGTDKVLSSLLHIRRADKSHLFSRAELERVLPRAYRGVFKETFDARVEQQRWPVGVGALYKSGSTQLFLHTDVQTAAESSIAPRMVRHGGGSGNEIEAALAPPPLPVTRVENTDLVERRSEDIPISKAR